MLKMWMEEYKPGHYIKYDGFRSSNQYTVIHPTNGRIDVDTLEKALKILKDNGGYYGSKTDCSIHFPWKGEGQKWKLSKIMKGKLKGETVCVLIEFIDDYCLVDIPEQDDGTPETLEILPKSYLEI